MFCIKVKHCKLNKIRIDPPNFVSVKTTKKQEKLYQLGYIHGIGYIYWIHLWYAPQLQQPFNLSLSFPCFAFTHHQHFRPLPFLPKRPPSVRLPHPPMPSPSSSPAPPLRVTIVGGGLAGCLFALLLSRLQRRRPVHVTVLEYRADPRARGGGASARGRSINLALSTRGLCALARAGLDAAVRALGVPMHGRCVHDGAGAWKVLPYGRVGEYLLSVSRGGLNEVLLEACEEAENVDVVFGAKCWEVDVERGRVVFGKGEEVYADLIVGADGTYSKVRAAMERCVPRFDTSREHIAAAYKELSIPKDVAAEAGLPREYLHVWPRHQFMLIALPNQDGSFTSTLFMDADRLEELHNAGAARVAEFFDAEFPDAVALLPDLAAQFLESPTPPLLTVRCRPYNWKGRAVLIGDAAHAIVPFFGQGCNAAFEDCVRLYDVLRQHSLDDLETALDAYSSERKRDADAIADLAVEHYHDMASKSASVLFAARRRLEILLHSLAPRAFIPLYSMVTFSNIPYATAVKRAEAQDRMLTRCIGAATGLAGVLASASVAASIWWRHRARY